MTTGTLPNRGYSETIDNIHFIHLYAYGSIPNVSKTYCTLTSNKVVYQKWFQDHALNLVYRVLCHNGHANELGSGLASLTVLNTICTQIYSN